MARQPLFELEPAPRAQRQTVDAADSIVASEKDVLERLRALNADRSVHGILVQLPLPRSLDPHRITDHLDPAKDVDGLNALNLGRLMQGQGVLRPCTPSGILRLLDEHRIGLRGKHAVVVGRSEIVGKPMALMLIERDATVTVCHSRTRDFSEQCRRADILIAAMGQPELIKANMVRDGVVVIDVGINRIDDPHQKTGYRVVGDVDYAHVALKCSAITPVPGGVGPMTIAMLLTNTVQSARNTLAFTAA